MGFTRLITFLAVSLAASSRAQTIAAWHNTRSAQVLVQDATTGAVYYSNCNSSGTPEFPTAPLNVLTFDSDKQPRNGSAFTAVGYVGDGTIYTQIWYQSNEGHIWEVFAQCADSETEYTVMGTYKASANVTTDISKTTGLTVLLLGSDMGYRLFLHNDDGQVYQVVYTPKNGWGTGSSITPDAPAGRSLASTFTGTSNLTIMYPLDSYSIETAQYNKDKSFHSSAFPYPFSDTNTTDKSTTAFTVDTDADVGSDALPNWSAANVSIGVAMDTTASARRVFYVDTMGLLQYYLCDQAANVSCSVQDREAETVWINGTASGSLGTAWDDDSRVVDLLYLSADQKLVMAELSSGIWNDATTITDKAVADWSTVGSSTSTSSGSSSSSSSSGSSGTNSTAAAADASSSSSGLSTGATAGIAIAVVVVVLGGGVAGFLAWRRRRNAARGTVTHSVGPMGGMDGGMGGVGGGGGEHLNSFSGSAVSPMLGKNDYEMGMATPGTKSGLSSAHGDGGMDSMTTTTTTKVNPDGTTTTTIVTRKMVPEADGTMLSNLHEIHGKALPTPPPPEIDGRPAPRSEMDGHGAARFELA